MSILSFSLTIIHGCLQLSFKKLNLKMCPEPSQGIFPARHDHKDLTHTWGEELGIKRLKPNPSNITPAGRSPASEYEANDKAGPHSSAAAHIRHGQGRGDGLCMSFGGE